MRARTPHSLPSEIPSRVLLEPLRQQEARIRNCRLCPLAEGRSQVVFGSGTHNSGLVIIGEAPGAEEDRGGLPFVGRSGQLLMTLLRSIGLSRSDVYITNMVKCRPPSNRKPRGDELKACAPHLDAQLEMLRPRVIIAAGSVASQHLLGTRQAITQLRGRPKRRGASIVVPTFHPAFLLRNPDQSQIRMVRRDLRLAKREWLRPSPQHSRG